jgi:hypothetical protein
MYERPTLTVATRLDLEARSFRDECQQRVDSRPSTSRQRDAAQRLDLSPLESFVLELLQLLAHGSSPSRGCRDCAIFFAPKPILHFQGALP